MLIKAQKTFGMLSLVGYISIFIAAPYTMLLITVLAFNIVYLLSNAFRFYLIAFAYRHKSASQALPKLPTLERYSILVPLYQEEKMVSSLVTYLASLNYPSDMLEILFVVEEDDERTICVLETIILPTHCSIIKVPRTLPRTKPKACNHALKFTTGKFITIYDAEDRPSLNQLYEAQQKFAEGGSNLACVQARLCFYNRDENWLTAMFSIEYELLFNYVLPSACYHRLPIPLGGTSNHFRTDILKKLGGWDPYNVTEDAELGLRIAAAGYQVAMVDSYTKEEATLSLNAWLTQRTRWLKGHLLTYFCYIRNFKYVFKHFSVKGWAFATYALFLNPMLLYTAPLLFIFSLIAMLEPCSSIMGAVLSPLACINLVFGLANFIYTAFLGAKSADTKIGQRLFFSYPLYLSLHIVASILAVYKLITSPHTWEKTTHGLTKMKDE